jgi:hypothetical protein
VTRVAKIVAGGLVLSAGAAIVWWKREESATSSSALLAPANAPIAIQSRQAEPPASVDARTGVEDPFGALVTDFPALLQANGREEINRRLRDLVKRDPQGLLNALEVLNSKWRDAAKVLVLAAWMREAPQNAMAWARINFPVFLQTSDYIEVCVARRDISLVEDGLMLAPEGMGKNFAMRVLTREWTKADPVFMTAWVKSLEARGLSGELRDYAISGSLDGLAREAPDEAIQWVKNATPNDNNSFRRYYQGIADGMIEAGNLSEAEKFFGGDWANANYNLAFNELAKALATRAPQRLENFFEAIGQNPFRNSAISTGISTLADTEPERAAQLFITYRPAVDAEANMRVLSLMIGNWAKKDRDAATRFVENASGLAPEERQRLRNTVFVPQK